jgi:hypothetical protein
MTVAENVETLPQRRCGNYEVARFNALRHGVLSQHTVLPWEDGAEYGALIEALAAEHSPQGPTEEHLVEELAGIFWRKRRLRLAEASVCHRGLEKAISPHRETVKAALVHLGSTQQIEKVIDAIRATPVDTAEAIADLEDDEAMTKRALDLLRAGKAKAYENGLAALREDTREWWEDVLTSEADDYEGGEEPFAANGADLRRFLESKVAPWFEARRKEVENRHLIRAQAFGEAVDPDRLERLARYEIHLDRKLERMLAMLLKLQDLRRAANPS